jgi:hypothetical protein
LLSHLNSIVTSRFPTPARAARLLFPLLCVLAVQCGGDSRGGPTSPSGPAPATISSLEFTPATISGGQPAQGTVTLGAASAPSGATVTLSSSAVVAAVPESVIVAAGATTATFTVNTTRVAEPVDVTIRAQLGSATRETVLHVVPSGTLAAIEIEPSVFAGGENSRGTIRLTEAALDAVDVTVSSSHGAAIVPRTVTVPKGADSATFTVTTQTVTSETPIILTATLGTTVRTVQMRLILPRLDTFFSYVSPPGEGIGLGKSEKLSPPANVISAVALCSQNWVAVDVGPFISRWGVQFSAPLGQRVTPGVYVNATGRIRGPQPGINVSGNARTCGESAIGSFTVTEASYTDSGEVLRFRATFDYRCSASAQSLRGEVSLASPPRYNLQTLCLQGDSSR